MPPLPADVSDRLVHGLGAFIRATPAPELPGPLRRYRSFVPKSLVRHRDALIASLESPDLRLKVLRWLEEGRPRLGSQEIAVLRIASERGEGWEGELASFSVPGEPQAAPSGDPDGRAGDLAGALERERERAKRYRAEAARIREEGRRALEAERARGRGLEAERSELAARLAASEKELAGHLKDGARAAAVHERELRRERRAAEAARVRAEGLKAEARAATKRESAKARRIEKLEAEAAARPRAATTRRGATPSRAERGGGGATQAQGERRRKRRPRLPAPKGLLETSGEALELWLEEPSIHLLVDGYNVSRAEGGYGDLELQSQRARLVDEVARLARRKGVRATVVFDGNEVPPGIGRRRRTPAAVEYSRPGESADDHLVMLLDSLPPDPVVVVTNDRELQDRAAALGATIALSNQLLELIR